MQGPQTYVGGEWFTATFVPFSIFLSNLDSPDSLKRVSRGAVKSAVEGLSDGYVGSGGVLSSYTLINCQFIFIEEGNFTNQIPPATEDLSKTITSSPYFIKYAAADTPLTPAPMTPTRFLEVVMIFEYASEG